MVLKAPPLRLVLAFFLFLAASLAAAQAKPRIDKAADLPRFTYRIDGKVEDVVRSPDKFAPFAAAVRRNTESVLADYDIPDKATRSGLIGLLATLDYLDGSYDSALQRIDTLRSPRQNAGSGESTRSSTMPATAILLRSRRAKTRPCARCSKPTCLV